MMPPSKSQMKMGSCESSTRRLLLPQLLLAVAQRLLDLQPVGDVDEGDDHAVDLVLDRAIGPQANVVPAAVAAAHLAPDRGEVGEHGLRVLDQESVVLEPMGEIGDGPALVAGVMLKRSVTCLVKRLMRRSESRNRVPKSVAAIRFCRSLWARETASSFSLSSVLTVCSSSLIDCSSSLLVSSSSAVERYSSLIDCSSSLAARSSSLAASDSSRVVRSRAWVSSSSSRSRRTTRRVGELLGQAIAGRASTGSPSMNITRAWRGLAAVRSLGRLDLEWTRMRRPVEPHQDRQAQRRLPELESPVQRRAQLEPQLRPHQVDHVAAERPAGRLQVAAGVIGQVHDPMRARRPACWAAPSSRSRGDATRPR